MVDRNAHCPCGSGKKYKKCHGASVEDALARFEGFDFNRQIAYSGEIGKMREAFCRRYTLLKQETTREVESGLAGDAAASGRSISCSKGCGECCSAFIVASLQECEAIVYHLYHHEDALRHFLEAYKSWNARVEENAELFRRVCSLQKAVNSPTLTAQMVTDFAGELDRYQQLHTPCPFLIEGACSIYEVRPYICASVVSTSPPEWCKLSHPEHDRIVMTKADINLNEDVPYFVKIPQSISYLCMQRGVYEILQRGYAALSSYPGLEGMARQALAEPEILAILGELERGIT